jgi:exodeoxyribonuclease VII large subunit
MCEELRGLGYFDPAHKVPVPTFPRKIAVITSKDGAALQDVIATARQRCSAVGLLIVDVRVQGEGAPEQVARAINWIDNKSAELGVDAILVTRGGGSIEDLWAFNTRVVADAAFRCKLPLVAAIGHESDVSVIELVADVRAATPTQAVMRLVPASTECNKQVEHLHDRLAIVTRRLIERGRHRLETLERHEAFRRPEVIIQRAAERIDALTRSLTAAMRHVHAAARLRLEQICGRLAHIGPGAIVFRQEQRLAILEDRLNRAARHRIDQRPRIRQLERALTAAQRHVFRQSQSRIEADEARLSAVDPLKVLERGYSVTYDADGKIVRSWRDVSKGNRIRSLVADGTIESVVSGSDSEGLKTSRRIAKPQAAGRIVKSESTGQSTSVEKKSGGKRQGRSQMDLFGNQQ